MDDLLRVVAVLALIGGNAFFVIGEYAVVTARRGPISAAADAGGRNARAALRLMEDPVRVISTVQVGITAVGILVGAVSAPLVHDLFGGGLPYGLSFAIGFLLVTYLSVVLGELVPKALTLDRAERLAMWVAPPIEVFAKALGPMVWVLQGSAQALLRPFGVREVVAGETIRDPEELRSLVDEAEGAGVIPRAQEELLHNVFDFVALEARDVMIQASDVTWIESDAAVEAAVEQVLDRFHNRYPVGRGSLDHVIGVVHVRELLRTLRTSPSAIVRDLARPAPIVPATKDVGALLRELREGRQQLAIVADEYGRTLGIVTIEDILEEIVGEIEDEYDIPDDTMTRRDDGTLVVAGSMTVDAFNEAVGIALPRDGPRTIAGLVFDALGRRPQAGEVVRLGTIDVRVEEFDGSRITRVSIRADATDG